MIRSMFSAISGLRNHQTMMDVVGNNISNVNTTGFKSSTTVFSQGALQRTGRATDMAVQGDGFFVVQQAGQQLFSRAGSFSIDAFGRLVTQEGATVQGWQAGAGGGVNTNGAIGTIQIPVGDLVSPVATDGADSQPGITLGGNLPADAADGTVISNSVEIFDSQGNPVTLSLTFEKTNPDEWTTTAEYVDDTGTL